MKNSAIAMAVSFSAAIKACSSAAVTGAIQSLRSDLPKIAKTIERIPGGLEGHEKDWVRACKGGKPASSNFDYSGPLSEAVLMGNLAVRFPNQALLWDGENMQVKNHGRQ